MLNGQTNETILHCVVLYILFTQDYNSFALHSIMGYNGMRGVGSENIEIIDCIMTA